MGKDVDITQSRLPAWTELKPRDQETVVWNAVYNARIEELADNADDARRAADQVVELIRRGHAYNEQGIREARRERRLDLLRGIRNALAVMIAIGAVLAGIGFGIYEIYAVHANDYAGVDPATVRSDAARAINRWFGQNDLPANLQIVSQTHSHLYGKKAWFVRYNGDHRGPVCVYVWGGGKGDYEKVETGVASCGR